MDRYLLPCQRNNKYKDSDGSSSVCTLPISVSCDENNGFREVTTTKAMQLMSKLQTSQILHKLWLDSPLHPKLQNAAKWSFTYQMLQHHTQQRQHAMKVSKVGIDALLLRPFPE